jgi:hypothetical protein
VVPLGLLLSIYGYASVREVLIGRYPERILNDPIDLAPPAWNQPLRWRYSVQNRLGRELGEALCDLAPSEDKIALTCEASYEGFDLTDDLPAGFAGAWENLPANLPGGSQLPSLLRGDPGAWTLDAVWSREALDLAKTEVTEEKGEARASWHYSSAPSMITLEGAEGAQALQEVPDRILLEQEWAWRLSGLPFQLPYGGQMDLVLVAEAGEVQGDGVDRVQIHRAFVQVRGGEPAWTPAGNFSTWKVTVSYTNQEGEEVVLTAWYQAQAPHMLVRFDDGAVSYLLSDVETGE